MFQTRTFKQGEYNEYMALWSSNYDSLVYFNRACGHFCRHRLATCCWCAPTTMPRCAVCQSGE